MVWVKAIHTKNTYLLSKVNMSHSDDSRKTRMPEGNVLHPKDKRKPDSLPVGPKSLPTEEVHRVFHESYFKKVQEMVKMGHFCLDPVSKSVEGSPELYRIFDVDTDKLLFKSFADAVHPEDGHLIFPYVERAVKDGIPYDSEHRICHRDGTVLYVRAKGDMIDTPKGRIIVGTVQDVTDHKRAEEDLRQKEERLRDIINHTQAGYFFIDRTGCFQRVNQAWLQMHGYSSEAEVLGSHFSITQVDNDVEASQRIVEALFAGQTIPLGEFSRRFRDGSIGYHTFSVHPVLQAGEVIGLEGFVIDITDRKSVEEELEKSEEKFFKVFQANPGSIAIATMEEGSYVEVNNVFLKQTGFKRGEVIGRTSKELNVWVNEKDRQRFNKEFSKNHYLRDFPVQYRMRSGEIRDFLVNSEVIELEGKKCSLNFIFDITERKRAEEALGKKDAMLANIASQVPGMLYQFMQKPDGTFCVPYSSDGVKNVFGCSPDEVRNDFTPILNAILPDDRNKIIQSIEVSATNLSQWMAEYRVQIPGEPVKWIFGNSIPQKMDDGSIIWSGYNMDISEQKRVEEEKAELEAHLQQAQKIESVGRLAGGVAHDFNNMLSVILGYSELALSRVEPAQPLYNDLKEIITAAQRAAKITRQLLAFARKQTVAPRVLNLNSVVPAMLKMLERLIGEDIHLDWNPEAKLWPVKVDPTQIDQILANLCVNARDAIPGVGVISIETGNRTFSPDDSTAHMGFIAGEYVRLTVSDNGRGMEKETLSHIFEPFFTTKEVGEGTGLGLAMIYGAVQQNNGFIDVQSKPGKGTTFSIYLPRYTGKEGQVPSGESSTPLIGGQETILLVEDEPAVLGMTAKMLEKQGYTVLAESVPAKAVQVAKEYDKKIHLLVTDVIMPGMNGRELWRQVSGLRPGMKCLFMSGYTASVIADRGVLEDGAHLIEKPFVTKALAEKVRKTLDWKDGANK